MLHRRIYPLDKQVALDREECSSTCWRGKWLLTALQGYRRCLEAGGGGGNNHSTTTTTTTISVIFRIIGIWFNICGGVDGSSVKINAAGQPALVTQVNEEVSSS